jgi:purine-binding chemotaxis protein CheW
VLLEDTINEQAIEKLSTEIATIGGNRVNGIAKIDQRLILLLNAL